MLNRSEILRTAWTKYRADAKWLGYTTFYRKRFAAALRSAWADAKLDVYLAELEAEEAHEAAAEAVFAFLKGTGTEEAAKVACTRAEARNELLDLQMKDHWTSADAARVSALNHALAA